MDLSLHQINTKSVTMKYPCNKLDQTQLIKTLGIPCVQTCYQT